MSQDAKYAGIFLILMAGLVFSATAVGVSHTENIIKKSCKNTNTFQIRGEVFECHLKI